MALLTLSQLLDDCQDEIPSKAQAQVVRACNKVIRRIQTEFVEPVRSTFTTRPEVTTGTVAVTQDLTLVTFSSSILSATDPVMLVRIGSDAGWFILTYASATTGNLSSKWAAATDAASTYSLVYPTVTFPAAVGRVQKIQRPGFPPLDFRPAGSCPWASGIPTSWSPYSHDETSTTPNDDLVRIFLDPAATDRLVYEYWYDPRTTFLDPAGQTTQTIPFSDMWYEAIVAGTLSHLWQQEGAPDKAMAKAAVAEAAFTRARGSMLPAGTIPRTRRMPGLYAYEKRPIGGN